MLDYIYALSLLSITFTLFYLTKSCLQFKGEIPHQGEGISDRIDKVADLLDEMADLISNAATAQAEITALTQTPQSPIMSILNAFMSKTASQAVHAEKKSPEWEVLQDHPQTKQAEVIIDGNSAEPISG